MRIAQIAWKFEGLQFCHQFFWNRLSHWWDIDKNMSEDFYFLDSIIYMLQEREILDDAKSAEIAISVHVRPC